LKLVANNSRFLLLPDNQVNNLGSRLLSLCLKRLSGDWMDKYRHPILLVETFVDPKRLHSARTGTHKPLKTTILSQNMAAKITE
jgi:hypothetical protein